MYQSAGRVINSHNNILNKFEIEIRPSGKELDQASDQVQLFNVFKRLFADVTESNWGKCINHNFVHKLATR